MDLVCPWCRERRNMSQVISSLSLIRGTILITTCHPAPEPTGVLVFRLLGWVTVGAAGHSLRASG